MCIVDIRLMVIDGYQWLLNDINGYGWLSMVIDGY